MRKLQIFKFIAIFIVMIITTIMGVAQPAAAQAEINIRIDGQACFDTDALSASATASGEIGAWSLEAYKLPDTSSPLTSTSMTGPGTLNINWNGNIEEGDVFQIVATYMLGDAEVTKQIEAVSCGDDTGDQMALWPQRTCFLDLTLVGAPGQFGVLDLVNGLVKKTELSEQLDEFGYWNEGHYTPLGWRLTGSDGKIYYDVNANPFDDEAQLKETIKICGWKIKR